nr:hypothetical protein [Tanacetum cinerariifolium]
MTRRSKRTTRIRLKLKDLVYTLTSKKNKQKHNVMETDKEGFSEECGEECSGNNENYDVTKEDCGETGEQGNKVENDQDKDDWSVDRNVSDIKDNEKEKKEKDKKKVDDAGSNNSPLSFEKIWNISLENIEKTKISVNKYVVLSKELDKEDTSDDFYKDDRLIVDRWQALNNDEISEDEDDILDENNATADLVADEIGGRSVEKISLELIPNKIKFYCTFVYASNNGIEIRSLWKELDEQNNFMKKAPWVLIRDFNVTLNAVEHSSRSSGKTIDIIKFNEAVNNIEFIGKKDQVKPVDDENFKNTLKKEEDFFMIRDVNNKEIKEAMFDINGDKSSGPNGFSFVFFKKAWDIVGNEELLRGYYKKNGPKRCAMQIDIQKAYDTPLNFLETAGIGSLLGLGVSGGGGEGLSSG